MSGEWRTGMSLRDWFAGQALTGIAGEGMHFVDRIQQRASALHISEAQLAAQAAYELADAMLAARDPPEDVPVLDSVAPGS